MEKPPKSASFSYDGEEHEEQGVERKALVQDTSGTDLSIRTVAQ